LTYRITFAVSGRGRFLAHLETVDTLLSALRRAGYEIALSQGMKPRPVISLALPRAVGVETLADVADVELVGDHDPDEVHERLTGRLPAGIAVERVERADGRPAASRVAGARYAVHVEEDLDWELAVARFLESAEAPVVRRSPKGERAVDVRRFCSSLEYAPGRLDAVLELTPDGTARPEEVARAAAGLVGAEATVNRIVRTEIELHDERSEALR
jgi:radical SAM-linked protein